MTLSTRDKQLLNAAQEILDSCEGTARSLPLHIGNTLADSIRNANYMVYLVLKPETRLIEDARNGRKE